MLVGYGLAVAEERAPHEHNGAANEFPTVTTLGHAVNDPIQAQVLADGRVTHAEMRQVLDAVVSCFEADGLDAKLEEFRPGRGWSLSVETAKGEEAARVAPRDAYCSARILSEVEHVYFDAHRLSPEQLKERSDEITRCLIERGNDIQGIPLAEAVLQPDLLGYEECEEVVDSGL